MHVNRSKTVLLLICICDSLNNPVLCEYSSSVVLRGKKNMQCTVLIVMHEWIYLAREQLYYHSTQLCIQLSTKYVSPTSRSSTLQMSQKKPIRKYPAPAFFIMASRGQLH